MSRIVDVLQRVEEKRLAARQAAVVAPPPPPPPPVENAPQIVELSALAAAAPASIAAPAPAPEPAPARTGNLLSLADYGERHEHRAARLIPIASGKGGVGKTNLSVNLSIALSQRAGKPSVVLMDADFGLPNADILLGASRGPNLDDFVHRAIENLSDIARPTRIPGLRFVSGSQTPSMTLSNLQYQERQLFVKHIKSLSADYVLLDLGASVHFEVLDFFSMVNRGVVITNPEPTARRDAGTFLRAALIRRLKTETALLPRLAEGVDDLEQGSLSSPRALVNRLDRTGGEREAYTLRQILKRFRPQIVINRAESPKEAADTFRKLEEEVRPFDLEPGLLGWVMDDAALVRAVKEESPVLLAYPGAPCVEGIRDIAEKISTDREMTLERNYFSFTEYIKRVFRGGVS